MKKRKFNKLYNQALYGRKLSRDTIAGSDAVKRAGILYLPMPTGWNDAEVAVGGLPKEAQSAPWYHKNPIYSAYLHRARFPEMPANAVRTSLGLATKSPSDVVLTGELKYLIDKACVDGSTLEEFFSFVLSEVLTTGNYFIVVDEDLEEGKFYLAGYNAESTPDWNISRKSKKVFINSIEFIEDEDLDDEDIDYETRKVFQYDDIEEKKTVVSFDIDKHGVEGEHIELSYRGKPYPKIPVFCAGSVENSPVPQVIPIRPISDISIEIYQETADLRQSHFMTCNPTLSCFGFAEDELPTSVGSHQIIHSENAQAKADYTKTDSAGLQQISDYIEKKFNEAAQYGGNFLSSGSKESGDALSIRQANRGANLVHCVKQVGMAIAEAINFIAEIRGLGGQIFIPNTEFTEINLTSSDIAELRNGVADRLLDHDTYLDNLRDAGYIDKNKTNEKIKSGIETDILRFAPDKDLSDVDQEFDEQLKKDEEKEAKEKKPVDEKKPAEATE